MVWQNCFECMIIVMLTQSFVLNITLHLFKLLLMLNSKYFMLTLFKDLYCGTTTIQSYLQRVRLHLLQSAFISIIYKKMLQSFYERFVDIFYFHKENKIRFKARVYELQNSLHLELCYEHILLVIILPLPYFTLTIKNALTHYMKTSRYYT